MTRAELKKNIRPDDRVFLANHAYSPTTPDHLILWPKIKAAVGERGTWYSTLRAICKGNHDYVVYLIADIKALECPRLKE